MVYYGPVVLPDGIRAGYRYIWGVQSKRSYGNWNWATRIWGYSLNYGTETASDANPLVEDDGSIKEEVRQVCSFILNTLRARLHSFVSSNITSRAFWHQQNALWKMQWNSLWRWICQGLNLFSLLFPSNFRSEYRSFKFPSYTNVLSFHFISNSL